MVTSTRCPDPILPLSDEVVPADPSRPPVRYPTAEELNAVVLPPPSEVFQQLYAREWQFVLRTVDPPAEEEPPVAHDSHTLSRLRSRRLVGPNMFTAP